jgi:hypothetical protein
MRAQDGAEVARVTLRVESGVVAVGPGTYQGEPHLFDWGTGFRPSAAILWWASDCEPSTTKVNLGGIGLWAADSNEASTSWAAADQDGPGVFRRWSRPHSFLAGSSPVDPEPELFGSVCSTDEGVGLAVRGRTTATWHVHAFAIGGADIHAATVTRVTIERRGAHIATELGFRPDFLFFLPEAPEADAPESLGVSVGFAVDPARQAACAFESHVGGPRIVARSGFRRDAVVAIPHPDDSWTYDTLLRLTSIEQDGFGVVCDTTPNVPVSVAILAIAGGRHHVGVGVMPRGRTRRARESVGIAPAGLLAFTSGLGTMERIRELGRLCLGGATRDRAGCVSWSTRRRDWPPEPRSRSSRADWLEVLDTTSGRLYARTGSPRFDGTGFAVGWTKRDRAAREFAYAAFGSSEPSGSGRSGRLRDLARRLLRQ